MASVLKGLTEILLLIGFVIFIYWINAQRPARTPFKPLRVKAWAPALLGLGLVCWILAAINLPHLIQPTPHSVTEGHRKAQELCLSHLSAERFLEASDAIRDRPASHTLGPKSDYRGPILFGFLNPIINRILFGTGVAASSFPVLVWMAFIAVQRFWSRRVTGNTVHTPSRSEAAQWGVLLPVINNVTYLSAAVTLSFYFYVDPARSQKCIYSSGHWYTYTCTNLTLGLVISHLWVYREQSVYAARLLAGYVFYTIAYQALAIAVLKNTQMYYHSAPEAQDGIRSALPVFSMLMIGLLVIQYVTFLVTEHPQSRTNKPRVVVDGAGEEAETKPLRRSARIAASPKKGATLSPTPTLDIPAAPLEVPPSPTRTGPSANTRLSAKKRRESESEETSTSTAGAPAAPPMAPTLEVPTTPSAPSLSDSTPTRRASGSGDARSSLLSQITSGTTLRHVDKNAASPAPPQAQAQAATRARDPHSDLMAQITSGTKLKHVAGNVHVTPKPQEGLAAMLDKIRVVVQPELDEDDEEWEHVSKEE